MNTFLITFGFFLAVIAAMAVGYIFQRKVVKGSCGGLGAVGIEKVCNCPEPCDARKNVKLKQPPAPSVLRLGKRSDRIIRAIASKSSLRRAFCLSDFPYRWLIIILFMYTVLVGYARQNRKIIHVDMDCFSLPLKCGITLRIERYHWPWADMKSSVE